MNIEFAGDLEYLKNCRVCNGELTPPRFECEACRKKTSQQKVEDNRKVALADELSQAFAMVIPKQIVPPSNDLMCTSSSSLRSSSSSLRSSSSWDGQIRTLELSREEFEHYASSLISVATAEWARTIGYCMLWTANNFRTVDSSGIDYVLYDLCIYSPNTPERVQALQYAQKTAIKSFLRFMDDFDDKIDDFALLINKWE